LQLHRAGPTNSEAEVRSRSIKAATCRFEGKFTVRIEFMSDYRSPYSYLANVRLKTLGVSVDHKPLDIVAVMRLVNNRPSPECPAKSRYAGMDAQRWAKLYDVSFSPNWAALKAMNAGALDGTSLSRAALVAQRLGIFDQVNDALFEAMWAGDDDLASEEGRSNFLKNRKIAADDLWRLASEPDIAKLQAEQAKEAADRGVFGVPTIFVGDEMFFGNDRLSFVEARLKLQPGAVA
jgi:2-hydroxychromene-2-carboxylate isomerase